jgi:hypothetical protein
VIASDAQARLVLVGVGVDSVTAGEGDGDGDVPDTGEVDGDVGEIFRSVDSADASLPPPQPLIAAIRNTVESRLWAPMNDSLMVWLKFIGMLNETKFMDIQNSKLGTVLNQS